MSAARGARRLRRRSQTSLGEIAWDRTGDGPPVVLAPFYGTPTRIIWGAQDPWLDPEVSLSIERQLPRADRVVLEGAGHFSMEDSPTALAKTLTDWLTGTQHASDEAR